MKSSHLLIGACLVLATTGSAQAQRTKSSTDGEPCCGILTINTASALVTARDKAGKATFLFTVRDARTLNSLRVGQAVSADFGTGKVTVDGVTPCCAIIKTQLDPAEPCCNIKAINLATGMVTAQIGAAKVNFNFAVKDAKLLRGLKVGQQVYADFITNKVRIHGVEPCCAIITQ